VSTDRDDVDATSAELIAALRLGGDTCRHAWNELLGRHSAQMYAVARSFHLDAATSEDLVQTAWLRLLERVDQLRNSEAVGAWLCTIVRNEALRLVTRRREIPTAFELDRPDDGADLAAGLIRDERAAALRTAFAYLSEDCQRLLRLTIADPPLSYDEIAAAVGRPRGSLGPTRRRCLDALRLRLPSELP
jgi:RNA polymerase sigma factor (sigma-70 family)